MIETNNPMIIEFKVKIKRMEEEGRPSALSVPMDFLLERTRE